MSNTTKRTCPVCHGDGCPRCDYEGSRSAYRRNEDYTNGRLTDAHRTSQQGRYDREPTQYRAERDLLVPHTPVRRA